MSLSSTNMSDEAVVMRADRRRMRDVSHVRMMLRDLKFALEYPDRVAQCLAEAPHIDGIYGFHRWIRQRRCKVCGRRIPMRAEKFCRPGCSKGSRRGNPYDRFVAASVPGKRVAVPEADAQQVKARELVERGCIAYRNRAGLIRDIGIPRKPEDRGRVFAVEAKGHDHLAWGASR